jgi:hypothetical protein
MTTATYRVEAHDGSCWGFGIRFDASKRLPVFCSIDRAATGTRQEMRLLEEQAERLCGGTLRVAKVPADF